MKNESSLTEIPQNVPSDPSSSALVSSVLQDGERNFVSPMVAQPAELLVNAENPNAYKYLTTVFII